MKLVKSFPGTLAGLSIATVAHAGTLPAKDAGQVEYVRVCSAQGEGYFSVPGTETCLRIGGAARTEIVVAGAHGRELAVTGFNANGRISLDAYTATAYGLLRGFLAIEANWNTGVHHGAEVGPDQAFIQFGGLTAGRATSFFNNSDLPTGHFGTVRFSDSPNTNLLAYTFSFEEAFTASLSLEGRAYRSANELPYVGERIPDLVGNIKYTGTWGSAQISGAYAQLRSALLVNPVDDDPIHAPRLVGTVPDTRHGYAVSAQVSMYLPLLADEDALWFAATYADGALGYLGFGSTVDLNDASVAAAEAYIDPATGDIRTGRGWSLAGGLTHYWTPQIRQAVFGSHAGILYGGSAASAGFSNLTEWRAGSNLIWTPVAGLDLGVEVLYANLDLRGRFVADGVSPSDDGSWEGRLRVQRDF